MSNLTAKRVAEEVRVAMARRRVPQTAVASRLQMSQAAVSRRLAGDVEFTASQLITVADMLDIDLDSLRAAPRPTAAAPSGGAA